MNLGHYLGELLWNHPITVVTVKRDSEDRPGLAEKSRMNAT